MTKKPLDGTDVAKPATDPDEVGGESPGRLPVAAEEACTRLSMARGALKHMRSWRELKDDRP